MKTNAQTRENQPARYRDARYSSRRLCLSWLATLLLATSGTATAATVEVIVADGGPFFTPSDVTIRPGDTVEWTWTTTHAASVTSGTPGNPSGLFNSGIHNYPYSFSYTFASAGRFDYYCILGAPLGMTGVVRVVESPAATVHVQVGGTGPFFDPDDVTIQPGDTVEWTWGSSGFFHSVTSGPNGTSNGLFDSGTHTDPFTFSFTFPNAGTFDYFCRPHFSMGMTGVVRVVGSTATPGTFGNISTRLRVETGNNVLIGGFIITGTQPKKIIVRAIGPSLPLAGALGDPTLELRDANAVLVRSNDNWRTGGQEAEIIATTIPPSNDLESAIVATLPANSSAYTAIVHGVNNGTGIGVVEAYDLDRTVDSKLANISTRGFVQTGDNVLIGGLIVLGQDPLRVIVRAIGPSLPVPGALGDPTLSLHDGNGAVIASNDNWRTGGQEAEIIATTIPPTNDFESAIVRNLTPGSYTAIVRGVNNTTGVALVEAYGLN